MGRYRSKQDDFEKISVSVFITNIPDSCSAKELFNACKQYGHVVDSFILNKRSKAGKRFGFVKFINVFNEERLVDNLGTVWIGRYRLHANLAKFKRPTVGGAKKVDTIFGDQEVNSGKNFTHYKGCEEQVVSSDPFGLNELIQNHGKGDTHAEEDSITDYGPIPFRFYHSWFSFEGFDQMVHETWNNIVLDDRNVMIRFKKKLQILKKEIRIWICDYKKKHDGRINDLKSRLRDIDTIVDSGGANEDILLSRVNLLKEVHDIQNSINQEGLQKAKIKWAINLKKSHLLGVGLTNEVIEAAAENLGCATMKTPFKYLGVMVGGNCSKVQAWEDTISKDLWIGDTRLCELFPRIYALETNKDALVAEKLHSVSASFRRDVRGGVEASQLDLLQERLQNVILSNMDDRWAWDLNGEGVFRVRDVRVCIDEFFLPKADTATRWVKYVPIKVNIFVWKLFLDRLPTRDNVLHRGVVWLRKLLGAFAGGGIYLGLPLDRMMSGYRGSRPSGVIVLLVGIDGYNIPI
uniref:RNA-directed DNA polymerase, eukaryota n=1 Tax=Tanacetum cinerariifolium TaxID=118510 RepID=A0A6L2KIH9_TANCI|nr:RNA-directed DNA polymerase, eukaryota [Tanacetum cinerariifolium]